MNLYLSTLDTNNMFVLSQERKHHLLLFSGPQVITADKQFMYLVRGACMMHAQCMRGACAVHVRCMCGACAVHA